MKYIVWDWNGTLLDDVPTCVSVMNGMLARRGLPLLTAERYREIFTFPVKEYYRAAGLDLQKEPFPVLAEEYITEYNRRALGCGLYPGARQVLADLDAAGYVQIIASASAKTALEEQVENCGVAGCFAALLGLGDSMAVSKAGLAHAYLEKQGVRPEDVAFIGDTVHDWEVAKGMGCRCVLIAAGHQSRSRLAQCGGEMLDAIGQVPECLNAEE